jgi:hypothetical protein
MSDQIDIKGLDLKIDPAIQKICEVSNATSSNTRSVLYILVIVNILSLIAVLNTRPYNWATTRINRAEASLRVANMDTIHKKSLEMLQQSLIRNKVENSQTVRIPILGNTFDVNDLNIVAGVTFLILLFILRFTIMREISNLKIALQAITERYPKNANKKDFIEYLSNAQAENTKGQDGILENINFTRRKHHYNFLSMNEIFTLPPLEIDDKQKVSWFFSWTMNHVYWLPSLIYFFILLNDVSTISIGWTISNTDTFIGLSVGLICTVFIAFVCHRCSTQKRTLNLLYEGFSSNRYQYVQPVVNYSVSIPWFVILTQLFVLLIVALSRVSTNGL